MGEVSECRDIARISISLWLMGAEVWHPASSPQEPRFHHESVFPFSSQLAVSSIIRLGWLLGTEPGMIKALFGRCPSFRCIVQHWQKKTGQGSCLMIGPAVFISEDMIEVIGGDPGHPPESALAAEEGGCLLPEQSSLGWDSAQELNDPSHMVLVSGKILSSLGIKETLSRC